MAAAMSSFIISPHQRIQPNREDKSGTTLPTLSEPWYGSLMSLTNVLQLKD